MTKDEFVALLFSHQESGKTLKEFLKTWVRDKKVFKKVGNLNNL